MLIEVIRFTLFRK